MFEDKTLVCKDAVRSLFGLLVSRSSTHLAALRTSPSAASPAVTPARTASVAATTAVSVRCSMLSAQLAARLARFPSSPVRTVRSTALTASLA